MIRRFLSPRKRLQNHGRKKRMKKESLECATHPNKTQSVQHPPNQRGRYQASCDGSHPVDPVIRPVVAQYGRTEGSGWVHAGSRYTPTDRDTEMGGILTVNTETPQVFSHFKDSAEEEALSYPARMLKMTVQPTRKGTVGFLVLPLKAPSSSTKVIRQVMATSATRARTNWPSDCSTVKAAPWAWAYFSPEVMACWYRVSVVIQLSGCTTRIIQWPEHMGGDLTLAMAAPSNPPSS